MSDGKDPQPSLRPRRQSAQRSADAFLYRKGSLPWTDLEPFNFGETLRPEDVETGLKTADKSVEQRKTKRRKATAITEPKYLRKKQRVRQRV